MGNIVGNLRFGGEFSDLFVSLETSAYVYDAGICRRRR